MKTHWAIGLIGAAMLAGCSEESAVQTAIDEATVDLQPGSRVALMRLANDAAIQNAIIHRVEGKWLLISEGAEDAWPYWVNFEEVILFQEKVPARQGEEPVRVVEQTNTRPPNAESLKEIAERLGKLSISLPGGKKWEELGYLQQSEWTQALDEAARAVMYPGSITVESVSVSSYSGTIDVMGDKALEPSANASFQPAGSPVALTLALPTFSSYDKQFQFDERLRSQLETLKRGDVLKVWVSIYPSIDFDGRNPTCRMRIGNRVELR